jgi:hypothetical protein
MGGWVGLLGLGMRGLTFHAEAGRQQWKSAFGRSKGGGENIVQIFNSSGKPASFSSTNTF